eukprot:6214208-Pleurochrysis_carterae.AAC.4
MPDAESVRHQHASLELRAATSARGAAPAKHSLPCAFVIAAYAARSHAQRQRTNERALLQAAYRRLVLVVCISFFLKAEPNAEEKDWRLGYNRFAHSGQAASIQYYQSTTLQGF